MQASWSAKASWIYQLAWLFYLILALAGVLWMGWREGRIELGQFIDLEGWWLDLVAGAAAAALLVAVWLGARRVFFSADRLELELAEMLGPLSSSEVVGLALLSGFAEEVFFRGAMQGAWGWVPATILFTLLHAGPGASYRIWTAFAAVAGLTLAGLMLWRGNLMAPVITHVVVNGVNLSRLTRRPEAQGKAETDQR